MENKNANFVMPAWIAGIQARKDALNLMGSTTPCRNDAIEKVCLERPKSFTSRIFKGTRDGQNHEW
jgi:hypothetical protein